MRVLLVVIDAASPRVVCPAVQTGQLPTLQKLASAGAMHQASVTIFPSITPAATTSIVTGAYPNETGIVGASWFDEARNEVAYYGDDFWVIAREGFGPFLRDFLIRLNGDRLKCPTLFELVEQTGRTAACVNYLVFRGREPHRVKVPWTLATLPGVPLEETVNGPRTLCLGDFVATCLANHGRKLKGRHGLLHRFGMDDASSGRFLCDLMGAGALPDLTVAYFADNDYRSHEVGPYGALGTVTRVDAMLGRAFEAAGGLERVLEDTFVLVTSDHGHCEILAERERAVVVLDDVLRNFKQAKLGGPWRDGDEIMLCPNMRAAQIYVREPTSDRMRRVIATLAQHPRIDQVMWRSELTGGAPGACTVATPRGRIEFARAAARPDVLRDAFGATWSCRGETQALDLQVENGCVEFCDYPNAFERLNATLFAPQAGELWVTASPGCEFEAPGESAHAGGGSHGALHALDSLSPVIAAGPRGAPPLPRVMRSIDVAPLCMQALGIEMRYKVGDPRR